MMFPSAITKVVARQVLTAQKNSPTILFGAGVVGMVGSTVLACRATLKLQEVLDTAQNDLSMAESIDDARYSEKDRKKDKTIIISRSATSIARLYAPAFGVGLLSVAALTKSHHILTDRNTALAAAYTAVDKAFEQYRNRVVEKYGEEEDRNLRHGTEVVEVVEDGKTVKHVRVAQDSTPSLYARFFDQFSTEWQKEPEYNLVFLRSQQSYANDRLITRGHVFLNEVYDSLGLPRTRPGSVVGWVISDDGDNFVDFGIWKNDDPSAIDFVNGREGAILLDFNVDGVIYDKIAPPKERSKWQS